MLWWQLLFAKRITRTMMNSRENKRSRSVSTVTLHRDLANLPADSSRPPARRFPRLGTRWLFDLTWVTNTTYMAGCVCAEEHRVFVSKSRLARSVHTSTQVVAEVFHANVLCLLFCTSWALSDWRNRLICKMCLSHGTARRRASPRAVFTNQQPEQNR